MIPETLAKDKTVKDIEKDEKDRSFIQTTFCNIIIWTWESSKWNYFQIESNIWIREWIVWL